MRQRSPPVQYEDTRTIATPEGVELRLHLAGLGSRFAAGMIDFAIKLAIVVVVALVFSALLGGVSELVAVAAGLLFAMVLFDILFEVRSGGRTPGKRALGLRVVLADGRPIGLRSSSVRNVLRLVEGLPLSTCLRSSASSSRTRTSGSGTSRRARSWCTRGASGARPCRRGPGARVHGDVGRLGVTPQELAAVRDFLRRRHDFTPEARRAVGERLAGALSGRVGGPRTDMPAERFLEDLAAAKASRR